MTDKQKNAAGIVLAVIAVIALTAVEQFIKPGYAVKSLIKVLLFAGCVAVYSLITKKSIKSLIYLNRPRNLKPLLVSIAVCFFGIFAAFLILRNQIDLSAIRNSLITKENLTKENCLFVFAYIIIVNSFLEEAFFRGFVTRLFANRKAGAAVSALLFSLYHIGIVSAWFNPLVFVLCIVGLAFVGLFLQWLCETRQSIVGSWIVHASANVAINIIGALLIFEIIS